MACTACEGSASPDHFRDYCSFCTDIIEAPQSEKERHCQMRGSCQTASCSQGRYYVKGVGMMVRATGHAEASSFYEHSPRLTTEDDPAYDVDREGTENLHGTWAPESTDGMETKPYVVERITANHRRGSQYYVKWKDYELGEYLPLRSVLTAEEAVDDYWKSTSGYSRFALMRRHFGAKLQNGYRVFISKY